MDITREEYGYKIEVSSPEFKETYMLDISNGKIFYHSERELCDGEVEEYSYELHGEEKEKWLSIINNGG